MLEKQLPDISEAYLCGIWFCLMARLLVFGGMVACPLSLDRLLFFFFFHLLSVQPVSEPYICSHFLSLIHS